MLYLIRGLKAHRWTAALVLVGFGISLLGMSYGLPLHLLGDEESLIGGALTMLHLRTAFPILHPEAFALLYYPPMIPYAIILFSAPVIALKWFVLGFSTTQVQHFFALDQDALWLAARTASAVSAAGVLTLTYLLARRLYSARVAFASTALLAVSFMQVNLAHWMKHWSFSVLCIYLVLFLTVRYVQDGQGRRWLPGLAAGLGAGVSSITALGGLAAAFYAIYNKTRIPNKRSFFAVNASLWFVVGGSLTALHASYFWKEYAGLFSLAGRGAAASLSVFSMLATAALGFRAIFFSDPVILFGALAGLLFAYRYRLQNRSILLGTFAYFLVLHVFFHFEPRYIYAVLPALAIASGSLADALFERMRKRVALFVLFAVLAFPAATALRFDYLLTQPDTRNLAASWIRENAPRDEVIISSPTITLFRDRDVMERESRLASLRAQERYLLEHYDELSRSVESVRFTNLHFWNDRSDLSSLDAYLDEYQPVYFILDMEDARAIGGMEYSLIAGSELVAEFRQGAGTATHDMTGNFAVPSSVVFQLERLGPTIQIYRL